jgi:hypothetical protein
MQKKKNMPQIIMLVYALILFLSLILVATHNSMLFLTQIIQIYLMHYIISPFSNIPFSLFNNAADVPCKTVDDCPGAPHPFVVKCINSLCDLSRLPV